MMQLNEEQRLGVEEHARTVDATCNRCGSVDLRAREADQLLGEDFRASLICLDCGTGTSISLPIREADRLKML